MKKEMITEKMVDEVASYLLNNMTDIDVINLWNTYCDEHKYGDDMIFDMCQLDDILEGYTPLDVLRLASDVNIYDRYFKDGFYGFESFDCIDDIVYFDTLADYVIENIDTDKFNFIDSQNIINIKAIVED